MRKLFLPLTLVALTLVGVLSYQFKPISFLLLAVMALGITALLILGILKAFQSSLNPKWLKLTLTITGICAAGILVGFMRPLEPAVIHSGDASSQLAYAYETDQTDRMTLKTYLGLFEDTMAKRDSLRLEQAISLYADQQISQPMDKFHAAFIFHHSKKPSNFEIAHTLASEAAAVSELQHHYVAQWLAKATYDRWMVSLGKPQKYGTQDKLSISVE